MFENYNFNSPRILATFAIGIFLLLIGVVGFFQDPVFGLFDVDLLHNIIHLGSGLLAVVYGAMSVPKSRTYGITMLVIYGLVLVLGLLMHENDVMGILAINEADNWLHLFLVIVFAALAFTPINRTDVGGTRINTDLNNRTTMP